MLNGLINQKYGQAPIKSWIFMLNELELKNETYLVIESYKAYLDLSLKVVNFDDK